MKKDTIYHVRLVNGDEILAKFSKTTKSEIEFIDVLVVDEIKNTETGQSSILLGKYSLGEEPEVTINKTHILTITSVVPEIQKYYLNSLVYNKEFIEENKLKEIKKINGILEAMINGKSKDEKLTVIKSVDDSKFAHIVASSNTIN